MTDKEQEIIDRLATISGVKKCGPAWPEKLDATPCIAVSLAGESFPDYRDDRRYLTELEYYVRVFASKKNGDVHRISQEVIQLMEDDGWIYTFRWEDPSADMRQFVMRFKKYF